MSSIVVSALYQFVRLAQPESLRTPLLQLMRSHHIRGTLILAAEGINGTVAGSRTAIDALYQGLRRHPQLGDLSSKESYCTAQPFYRTKVKLKQEIVTLGLPHIDPQQAVGTYVTPKDWNSLISDPDVLLIDTRNDYEVQVGTFKGAVNPNTESFRDFPAYAARNLDPNKHKKIAMFCTGGIRCEKSTAYLKQQGFEQVYHLRGGILQYLEEVDEADSLWQGDCFVFDNRVTVGHGLKVGDYQLCHACRAPLSPADREHPHFIEGQSCHHCFNRLSQRQQQRVAERQKQVQLAQQRGSHHLGSDATEVMRQRRTTKAAQKHQQRAAIKG